MSKLTKMIAAASAAAVFMASVPVLAAEAPIPVGGGDVFDFQPTSGMNAWIEARDDDNQNDGLYGPSEHYIYYNVGPKLATIPTANPEGTPIPQNVGLGEEYGAGGPPNYAMNAVLNPPTESGDRYVNMLFPSLAMEGYSTPMPWAIAPGYTMKARSDGEDNNVARIEFDWRADIVGTGGTQDTYFIGTEGVKYFGVRSSYHSNSNSEPWDSTIEFINNKDADGVPKILTDGTLQEGDRNYYHSYLKANQWYKISVTVDFETQRVIKAEYRRYYPDTNTFDETPVVTLEDMPFLEQDENAPGIGAVRLESVRGDGDITIDWNIDNFRAWTVYGEYHKASITLLDGESPVPGVNITISCDRFTSTYTTDADGQIQTKLAPGEYEYTVSNPGYDMKTDSFEVTAEGVDKTIQYNAKTYDPEPQTVTIEGGQSSLTAPHTDEHDSFTSAPYTVRVTDQEGVERMDYNVKWAISPQDSNVSIDENTGAVTVTKGFDGGTTHIKTFTVTPTVTIGEISNNSESAEIEISDYLFYDSGKNGSSYGDPDTPPETHEVGGDGKYMATSAGGDYEVGGVGRNYTGIINLPEPIEFTPGSIYEMSFETAITSKEVNTFGRSLILCGVKEAEIPEDGDGGNENNNENPEGEQTVQDDESADTGDSSGEEEEEPQPVLTDVDLVTMDYIGMDIGRRKINPENPGWSSSEDGNTLETTYGKFSNLEEWKKATITFETDAEGVTTAKIVMDGENEVNLGELDADNLAKIKLAIARCETVTNRFAAVRNVVVREIVSTEFDVGEYTGEAMLIFAKYGSGGALTDAEIEHVTLDTDTVTDGKYIVDTTDIEPDTKIMLWTTDKYKPFARISSDDGGRKSL